MMKTLEFEVVDKYQLYFLLDEPEKFLLSTYRDNEYLYLETDPFKKIKQSIIFDNREFSISDSNNLDDVEKCIANLILEDSSYDILVQALIETPIKIKELILNKIEYIPFKDKVNIEKNPVIEEQLAFKLVSGFLNEPDYFNQMIILSNTSTSIKETLIDKLAVNPIIREIYDIIVILRERKKSLDEQEQRERTKIQIVNLYNSWKHLEKHRKDGLFDDLIKMESELTQQEEDYKNSLKNN